MWLTWLIHVCDMTHVWHVPLTMCVMTHSCDKKKHSCGWHYSCICVTWLIQHVPRPVFRVPKSHESIKTERYSRKVSSPPNLISFFFFWFQEIESTELMMKSIKTQVCSISDYNTSRLIVELETGGNIRLEVDYILYIHCIRVYDNNTRTHPFATTTRRDWLYDLKLAGIFSSR